MSPSRPDEGDDDRLGAQQRPTTAITNAAMSTTTFPCFRPHLVIHAANLGRARCRGEGGNLDVARVVALAATTMASKHPQRRVGDIIHVTSAFLHPSDLQLDSSRLTPANSENSSMHVHLELHASLEICVLKVGSFPIVRHHRMTLQCNKRARANSECIGG